MRQHNPPRSDRIFGVAELPLEIVQQEPAVKTPQVHVLVNRAAQHGEVVQAVRVADGVFAKAIQRLVCTQPMAMEPDGHGSGRDRLGQVQPDGQPPRLRAVPLAKNQKLEKEI